MFFEFNCSYHLYIYFEKNINPYYKSKITNKLKNKLRELIIIYCKKFIMF